MPKHHTTTTTKPPPRPPRPPSTKSSYSFTKQRSRPTSRSYKEQSVSSVMQNAHDIVFKRQWPTITAPTSLNSPRTSATTAFFKMDQRNMKKVAPVKIVLPDQVKRNIENNMKKKQQRMMLGTLIPSVGNSKGYYKGKKSADQNQHRMRISAPAAGKNRSKGASAQSSLQNRFASRRSYIPMAQETPDMREVRIERHRKKQLSQQGKRSQQIAIQKLSQRHHHTSRIEAVARRNRFNHNNEESQNSKQKDGVGTAKPGHHSMEELEKNKTEESEDGNRQMQVLSALMKRVADSSKFFADENIARSVMTEVDQDEMGGLRRGFDMNPGGLTLPQFIELMLGFVPISEEEEHEIQEMHQHHHHHLHHKHHHRHHTNMGQVVHVKGKSRLQLARNLCELFEQIDINGDGTLEWDEFTSYCVSQGLANDKKPGGAIKRYKLLRTYNCYNQGIGVIDNMESFVLNGDEWDMTKANIMRMARVNPKRVTSLTSGKNNYRSDKEKHQAGMTLITCDRNAIHMGTFSIRSPRTGKLLKRCGDGVHKNSILAICYIPCMELIVTSSADLTLGFWDSHKYDLRQLMPVDEEMLALHWVNSVDAGLRSENSVANRNNLNPNSNRGGKNEKNIGSNQDDEQKRKKTSLLERFSSGIRVGTLYTGDVEGKITAWNVANMFVEASLEGHTDSVTSFLSIATLRLLVSSSMDSTVRIWNLRSNAPLKVLRGHSRGVSSVAFSSEQRVLLSCGFDHEIFVWNPYVETRTSGKLRGHTCSILSVKCVEGTKEAISVDIEGNLRVWDLRTLQCVQILAAHEAAGGADEHLYDHVNNPNTPNPDMFKDVSEKGGDCLSWCYVHHPDGNRIMVSTERQLRVYAYDEVTDPRVADANVSNALVYNPLTSSFLTAGGQTCKNWDAATGKLLHTFENIIEEDKVEITALCYDDQYRQFLLGDTMGRIRMYQCSNGQLLRNLVSHSDGGEVVAIMFNRVTDCIYSSSSKGQLIAQEDDGEGTDEQNAEDDAIVPPLDPNNEEGINVGREAGELFRKTRHDLIHLFTSKYAPPCEVTSLVQGPTLGLLAWGGADGDVVIIDCITGHTEGMCVPATTGTIALKARIPVTALTFLEPYPLLAVSYGDGSICIWSVRPFYIRQCPLMIFYNYKRPKIHLSPALAASAPWIFKKQVHPSGETVDVLKMCKFFCFGSTFLQLI
jgi:WD40 repeat protein